MTPRKGPRMSRCHSSNSSKRLRRSRMGMTGRVRTRDLRTRRAQLLRSTGTRTRGKGRLMRIDKETTE
jgi:hypothetical protein